MKTKNLLRILLFLLFPSFLQAQCLVTTPDICIVTVDTSIATHMTVIWEKPAADDIDSFRIYRETLPGTYIYIASVAYEDLSSYDDMTADPNIQSYRYKISALDTCGVETAQSLFHRSMFIDYIGGGTFQWNDYEIESGINPALIYQLWRDDTGASGSWVLASSSVAGTTLTDPAYASYPSATYQLRTYTNINCDPTRATVNTTRSNIKNQTITTGQAIPGSIQGFNLQDIKNITVFDMLGRMVLSLDGPEIRTIGTPSLGSLNSGIYLCNILTENGEQETRKIQVCR